MADLGSRHRRDALSLVMGLLMLGVAGLFLLGDLTSGVDLRWAGPVVLIGIGLIGLVASMRRRQPH